MTDQLSVPAATPTPAAGATPAQPMGERASVRAGAVVVVAVLASFTHFWKLGTRTWFVDEVVYVLAGRAQLDGQFDINPEHPPLAKYIIGLGDLVFGRGPTRDRLVPALVGLALVVVIFLFGRALMGFWAGLLAAGAYALVPHPLIFGGYSVIPDRIDRYAMLEPPAVMFALAALAAGWCWAHSASWRWAMVTGVLLGAAAGSKLTGGLVVPAVVGLVLVVGRDRRRLMQVVAVGALSLAVLLATYAALGGDAVDTIRTGIEFQRGHAAGGHAIFVANDVRSSAPWWANFWFHWESDGPVILAALAIGVVAAWSGAVPRRAAGYLTASIVVPIALLATSPVALPHYRMAWMPQLFLLAGLGLYGWLCAAGVRRVLGLAALALFAVAGIVGAARLAGARPADYALLADRLEATDQGGASIAVAGYPPVLRAYLPEASVSTGAPATGQPGVVVLDPLMTDRVPDPGLEALARDLGYTEVRVDRLRVWVDPRSVDPSEIGTPLR